MKKFCGIQILLTIKCNKVKRNHISDTRTFFFRPLSLEGVYRQGIVWSDDRFVNKLKVQTLIIKEIRNVKR